MNKIATYLNEHILGEATGSKEMRRRFSRDGSILTVTPELIVFPRSTSDIRKVTRFTWQLAEKGHPLAVTARGAGGDTTGAAIGKGVVVDTSAHMNAIFNIVNRDKLIHVQPGILVETVLETLRWQGLTLRDYPNDTCHTTVGGMIANGSFGETGAVGDAIEKLEVVLANGDILETGRVSKHDVNKKLGLQTFEGEIYRKISGLLEDHADIVDQLNQDERPDNFGYKAIGWIKQKDGSLDLTPLFIGSQGTLGIISEAVLRTEFYAEDSTAAVIVADSGEHARDLADQIKRLKPTVLTITDAELYNRAKSYGKKFALLGDGDAKGSVLYVEFKDFSDRARKKKVKKLHKLSDKLGFSIVDTNSHDYDDFSQIRNVTSSLTRLAEDTKVTLPIIDGAYIADDRREECLSQIAALGEKLNIELPMVINANTGIVTCYPIMHLHSVSDKQKIFRLLNEYAAVVKQCGGTFVADGAEGRLKSHAAWSTTEPAYAELFTKVREIFDPFNTMNPGVKQKDDVRTLVSQLRSSYDTTDFVA